MNSQLQAILRQLSITQRIGIVFAAVASVAMIGILVMFASKPNMTPAFSHLTPTEAGAVSDALRAKNIAFEIADAGTTVLVPTSSLSDAKIAAAAAGVTTDSSGKGFELFDNQGFGMSQFDQQVTYQRAIEGELTRTIQAMDGVSTARVAVVLGQKGVLSSQDTPASASIVLSMRSGQQPSAGLVQAIVNTVAGSVSGLDAQNVVVADDKGHVLAGAADAASSTGAQAKDLAEQQVKSKVLALVDQALGAGHASVAVSADVDMSRVEEEITTYKPVDTSNYTPVSVHRTVETYSGTDANGNGGVPGAISNIPGLPTYPQVPTASSTPAPNASASPSPSASPSASGSPNASASPSATASGGGAYIKSDETVNYNLSQTVQKVVQAPGVVKKVSVAVLVDQAAMGSITADTLKTSIQAAIGADTTRGDVVAISAVPFSNKTSTTNTPAANPASDIMQTASDLSGTIIAIVLALVMLVIFFINNRALRRRAEEYAFDLGPAPAAALMPGAPRGATPELAASTAPAEMPEATPQARIQERLRMVADEKPEALVNLMHGWLREEERRR